MLSGLLHPSSGNAQVLGFTPSQRNKELLKQISDKNFSFAIAEKIIEFFFNRLIKVANNAQINFFVDEQKVFLDLLKNLAPQKTFAIADESLSVLHKAQKLYLDKKLCVINIFNRICHE